MSRSDSVVPAAGGCSGGGLFRGKGLGSGGDSKGGNGAEVLSPVRGVSGSLSTDLVKEKSVSMV